MGERGNPEVHRTFTQAGGFAEKKTDLWNALKARRALNGQADPTNVEPGGHPDYTVLFPPFGFFVEVKSTDRSSPNNLPFAEIGIKQRQWLDRYVSISYLWLFMGAGRPTLLDPALRRRAWLVPWADWLERVERPLRVLDCSGLSLVPHRRELRAHWSAPALLSDYELAWEKGGYWKIPAAHTFWVVKAPVQSPWSMTCLS